MERRDFANLDVTEFQVELERYRKTLQGGPFETLPVRFQVEHDAEEGELLQVIGIEVAPAIGYLVIRVGDPDVLGEESEAIESEDADDGDMED